MAQTKQYAPVLGLVMAPVALTAYVLAAWRLGADMNWFSEFFIERGLLSRWQVWLALAAATQITAQRLNRRVTNDDAPAGS